MVVCNGIPKSGTHALMRAVELLGQQARHEHLPYDEKPQGRHILIARHPRNVLVSWLRFAKKEVTEGFLIGLCKEFDGLPPYESWGRYAPYLSDQDTLVVRFERLFTDGGETLERMANYLGCAVPGDAYENIVGLTRTYTGKLSNWEDHWTPLVDKAWKDARGLEIEAEWNY